MKITIIGTGYVGLVTGACLADVGNEVVCLDLDATKIRLLDEGRVPFYEPGLESLVLHNIRSHRISFTTDAAAAVAHGEVQFIAVGTPPGEDGSADLQHVLAAARTIGRHMTAPRVVVDKSTVPVGTAARVAEAIRGELLARQAETDFAVVSNPEFLKEGAAIEDFMRPDRIVVGSNDAAATDVMRRLYAPFERNHAKLMLMDVRSAELTKYAANAMLATRISFMNELALLAEGIGADIDAVRRGMGGDQRIGTHFLYAGCGYGGSCFPKDIKALIRTAKTAGRELRVLEAVEAANEVQKQVLLGKIAGRFGESLAGKRFAVWGLAFKPNTDDIREAPSIELVQGLLARGASVAAYDPIAMEAARAAFGARERLDFAAHALDALEGADALVIVTEWKEFRSVDLRLIGSTLRQPVVFDGRNIFEPADARAAGVQYFGIGRS